jgi:hypothetical protein
MHQQNLRRTSAGVFALALGVLSIGANAAPPDIVGIQAGMSPGDAYNAIRAFDTAHRVKIGQVAIPQLLGAKPAVYAMGPETENSTKDDLYVNLTLPPNPQQVWQIHRAISQIPNTLEQIVASLLQKYGSNYAKLLYNNYTWIFTEQGEPANLSRTDFNACEYRMAPAILLNLPPAGPQSTATIANLPPLFNAFPPLADPNQFPQCQHLVWVKASITGGYPNSHLDIDIQYPGLQHRTTYALTNFFNDLANKVQQQELKKNEQTAVPKL